MQREWTANSADGHDPYAALPALYDLEHDQFTEDIAFYLQLAEVVGDPILELGCGTGRVLAPLAEAGWRVTGIDRSGPMLDKARIASRNLELGTEPTLVHGEMRDAHLAPGGPFGLVIVSLNGLMHAATQEEQRNVLCAANRALDPRGMVVVDALNPSPDLLASFDGRVTHDGSWHQPDGGVVDRFSARTVNVAEQHIETDLWYDITKATGELRRVRTRFPMRYVTRAELELLLELTGFVEWQVYGSYELDPYDATSDRLLVTAEVTAS